MPSLHRVHRYRTEDLARPVGASGPKRRLFPEQGAELAEWVRRGPTWPPTAWCAGGGPASRA
ncbi:hypothetical protein [Caldovatus sediminis]|uniref:hypothetical protein n=1 Tax=Caldovatus sediminis TaxID=2041189 RepID=UPI0016660673|nr:hypothetical protein [Caldovatus sediminis]